MVVTVLGIIDIASTRGDARSHQRSDSLVLKIFFSLLICMGKLVLSGAMNPAQEDSKPSRCRRIYRAETIGNFTDILILNT